jgi:predicted DNA-binding antitoxin AbrB/MazE fold protein
MRGFDRSLADRLDGLRAQRLVGAARLEHGLRIAAPRRPEGRTVMDKMDLEVIYERGTLQLSRQLPLSDGQKVTITIHPTSSAVERLYGMIPWEDNLEEFDHRLNDPDEGQWGNRDV